MSGIAEILLQATPLEISGCDMARSENTARLESHGARIEIGHDPSHVENADLLVISSAVAESNPEVAAARAKGVPVIRRAEMLGEIMRLKQGIAVAGTHGKTTTTSLTGMVLTEAGFDPTIVVGGQVHILGTNARLGQGEYLVAEADEFDRSFLELTPVVAVITNVEADHLDTYRDLPDILDAFAAFANRVPFYGSVIVCVDDPGARSLVPRIKRRVVTYGQSHDATLQARETRLEAGGTTFDVFDAEHGRLGVARLKLPGRHNVANALAAIAVGRELSVPFPTIARALEAFTGVVRRFEKKGERSGVLVVDDYAHHPTEISATLQAARQVYPERRLVALFQPHLFTRTRDFSEEFGRALAAADASVVMDVYPSREKPIPGVTGALVADAARRVKGDGSEAVITYISDKKDVVGCLERTLIPGDLLVTLGAGDVVRFGEEYLRRGAAG